MKRTLTPAALSLTVLAAGLALLASAVARAAAPTAYTIQPLVKLGDQVADLTLKDASNDGYIEPGSLNDNGQLALDAANAAGGEMLFQYTNGQFTPIVVAGRDAPGGKWVDSAVGVGVGSPVSMNERGDMVFATGATIGGTTDVGTFRWDSQTQTVTTVAFKGMPAANHLTFVSGSNSATDPLINNNGEVAFPAGVLNAAGAARSGVFIQGQDGQIQAVVLPDQVLPDGTKVQNAAPIGFNDNGVVTFDTYPGSADQFNLNSVKGAYLWEKGTITPIATVGAQIPGLGKVVSVAGAQVNNKDRSAIMPLKFDNLNNHWGEYRWVDGQFTRLFAPGQAMPGGGQLVWWSQFFVASTNDAGQFAFYAGLNDGSTAAYLLDTDGTLSLILKSGTTTPLGKITVIGGPFSNSPPTFGIGLNDKGQVALPVQIDGGPYTLVLLTPSGP